MAYSRLRIEAALSNAACRLGYQHLTDEQCEAVVSLPTGTVKSLCYGLLPFVFDLLRLSAELRPHHSEVVVVSPLKSLMDDQVAKFSSRGMKCASLHGDGHTMMQGILHDEYQLVFISRESMLRDLILREMFRSEVYQKNLVALVVDEAHCVDKWYAI